MKKFNTIRIAAMSDLHGYLPDLSKDKFDVAVIAGDIVPTPLERNVDLSKLWLEQDFSGWAKDLPCKKVIICSGNHDFVFEKTLNAKNNIRMSAKIEYLQDDSYTHKGFKFYGSPWTPWFYEWAFNLDYSDKHETNVDPNERQLEKIFSKIPEDTDILLTHGPPKGYKDLTPRGDHAGSRALLRHVKRVQPYYHFFGHIHLDYQKERQWSCLGKTIFVNVSVKDNKYKVVREPVIVEAFKES